MSPFRKKSYRVRTRETLDTIETDLRKAKAAADEREPRILSLWAWALQRRVTNGVAADFEYTLDSPRQLGRQTP